MERAYRQIEERINNAKDELDNGRIVASLKECRNITTDLHELIRFTSDFLQQEGERYQPAEGILIGRVGCEMIHTSMDNISALQGRMAEDYLRANDILEDAHKRFWDIFQESEVYKWRNPTDPPFMHNMMLGYGQLVVQQGNLAHLQPFRVENDKKVSWTDAFQKLPVKGTLEEAMDTSYLGDTIIISSRQTDDPTTLLNVGDKKYEMTYKMLSEIGFEVPSDLKGRLYIRF